MSYHASMLQLEEAIEEVEVDERRLTPGLRTLVLIGLSLTIVAGIVLRFWTNSAEWLDEALTVNIAKLPLHQLPAALKRDGAPPAFYVLLHFWMKIFGESDLATRSLSGILGLLTLPVAWILGKNLGGRTLGWTVVALLASAPFAVYYTTEARMYGLVILLTGCGLLGLQRALERPRIGNLTATAASTAGLLYTQYWSLYLVLAVLIWLLIGTVHARPAPAHPGLRQTPSFAALCAVLVGCLGFVPWVPIFLYQSRYTGTPWATPANFSAVINGITGFTDNQATLSVAGTTQGRLLAVIYFALAALAVFGVARSRRIVDLDLRTIPRARGFAFVVLVTLVLAIVGGLLSSSAFASRYTAVVFIPFLLLVALGTTTFLDSRLRVAFVAVAVLTGFAVSAQNVTTQRTQATSVAAVLNSLAKPGDVIAFCPDQLGPSVYRVVDNPSAYQMITFPRGTGPQFVDWVDYGQASRRGNTASFAASLLHKAFPSHRVWLVWEAGYQSFGTKCQQMTANLLETKGVAGHNWVINDPTKYYEPMNLTEYASLPS